MESNPVGWVFFCTARKKRIGFRRWLRIALACPTTAYRAFLVALIQTLSRSPLVHVCIGDGSVVLDPNLLGNRYWAAIPFAMKYPRLAWCFEIRLPYPLDLEGADTAPKAAWPSLLRWLTRGHTEADDCVTTTADALRAAGEPVPQSVVTPQDLFDWLRSRGHHLIDMDDS